MAVRRDVELLRKVPLFAQVDAANLQVLVFSSREVNIAPGDYLVRRKRALSAGFLILDGKAEALMGKRGEEVVVAELGAGAFVCGKSMVAKLAPNIDVRAVTALSALSISHDLFLRVCKEFPETGAQILRVLSREVDVSLDELKQVQTLFDNAHTFSQLS